MSFIWFIKDGKFVNEYLVCKELENTMSVKKDIFQLVNENILLVSLKWKTVSFCFSASMPGNERFRPSCVAWKSKCVSCSLYMMHREALVSKSLPNDLLSVLNQAIQVVNSSDRDLFNLDFSLNQEVISCSKAIKNNSAICFFLVLWVWSFTLTEIR